MADQEFLTKTILLRFAFLLRLPVLLLLAHAYVAARLVPALFPDNTHWILFSLLVAMYLVMMAGFMVRNAVGKPVSDAISWAGFIALGLFSWLFVLTLLRDLILFLFFVMPASPYLDSWTVFDNTRQYSVWLVVGLSLFAALVGLFNARRPAAIVDVDIFIAGLPAELDGFTIAQITDLHVGPTIKKGFVRHVVRATNALGADIIVLTGDLIDGSVKLLRTHTQGLSELQAPSGVYVVTGNHEYYAGAAQWVDEFQRLGLTVLMNQHVVITYKGARIIVAGVTDFGAAQFDESQASDPQAALQGCPPDADLKILLAHQPRSVIQAAEAGFDLQLSGHTHGGQFWPWAYFVPLQQPFVAGLHRYQNTLIYISRGTGYWGPPLRFGARSEISRIHLRCKESTGSRTSPT